MKKFIIIILFFLFACSQKTYEDPNKNIYNTKILYTKGEVRLNGRDIQTISLLFSAPSFAYKKN